MDVEELKKALETRDNAIIQRLEKIDERDGEIMDRIEELESRSRQPGATQPKGAGEHEKRFMAWLRDPQNPQKKNDLGELQQRLIDRKEVNLSSGASGEFGVPESISRDIERLELQFSPVRRLVKVERTSTGDFKKLVNIRGATAGWVGESDPRSATNTSLLREVTPTFGELYAYPAITEWAMDDIFFNARDWLIEEVAQQFAQLEGAAVISGDGTNKPTGMLNTTPEADDDFASPLRSAAAYEFIACLSPSSPPVAEITGDCLIDLVYAVRTQYRARATWVMNSLTARAIRKLKDAEGNYLWQPGLAAGQPDRLLGYPVETWEQMPDIGTNNFPVAFGDFSRAYSLVDRTDLRITVDSNITTPGKIKYYVRRRVGGHVTNNDAVKFLRTTVA